MKKIPTEEQFFILLEAKSCFERRVAAYIELSRVKKHAKDARPIAKFITH